MGKFANLQKSIFDIFDSAAWKAEGVRSFPENVNMDNAGTDFININIVPGPSVVNSSSVSGVLIIYIFIAAGLGTTSATTIADKLDTYFNHKTHLDGRLQFTNSAMQSMGPDNEDQTLFMYQYSVPFNFFGEI